VFVESLVKIVCEHSHYQMLAAIAESVLYDLKSVVQVFDEIISEDVDYIE